MRVICTSRGFGTIVEDVETGQVFTVGDEVTDAGRAGTIVQIGVAADGSLLLMVVFPGMGEPVYYSTRHGGTLGLWDAGDLTRAG